MMVLVCGGIVIIACLVVAYHTYQMKNQNYAEYKKVEDLKKRIDELDNDNVDVNTTNGTSKIIVPDAVDPDESTRKSTQKEDCKEYTVGPKQKIEKTVVGSKEQEKVFVNTEIERVEDKDNDPIKEKESFVSKLLNNKKDEE